MANKNIKFDLFDTYLAMIKNSPGTKMFRNTYIYKNGKKEDATEGGIASCAVFVTAILKIFDLISEGHATVVNTEKDMEKNGWYRIEEPRVGAVVTWDPWEKSEMNHIGFYVGDNKVISNSQDKRAPIEHHITYGEKNGKPNRKVINIWWHSKLNH